VTLNCPFGQDYDSDKMFPALGFGARIPPTGEVGVFFLFFLQKRRLLEHSLSVYFQSFFLHSKSEKVMDSFLFLHLEIL